MAYQMDFFAANTIEKVTAAIASKKVQYPAYVFIRNEDSTTGRLAFVDQNNVVKYIVGEDAKKQVVNVETLPAVGDVEVLYIMNGIVYVYDGKEYKPTYKDHSEELSTLAGRITALETSSADVVSKVTSLETNFGSIESQIETIKTSNNEIAAEITSFTEQMAKIEDKIVEVEENSTLTFIELE